MSPKAPKAQRPSIDLSQLSQDQLKEIQKMLNEKSAAPTPQDSLAVVKSKKPNKVVESKKRVRTRRMAKVNGLSMMMFLDSTQTHIVLQCLEDRQDELTLPLDWSLAKKAAKVLANYVKAKRELAEYQAMKDK